MQTRKIEVCLLTLSIIFRLTNEQIASLMKLVTLRDVNNAFFSMGGDDGFQFFFYQFWDVVGPSLCCMALRAFRDTSLPQGINPTLIKLIPKVSHLKSLTHKPMQCLLQNHY